MTEGDFGIDLQKVKETIDDAEVMSLFFPSLRKSLIIDVRTNERDGPMVRVMPMAASPQERLRGLRRMRPGFPRLRSLTLIPWLRYIDSLVTTGVWERVIDRLSKAAPGNDELLATCDAALKELKDLEKAELLAVVRGDNYRTIWSAR